uniref:Aldose reductase n=2 Tax=Schistocephalus solidus TaxID=70667 RepID=A0A0X3PRH5_SCHSO
MLITQKMMPLNNGFKVPAIGIGTSDAKPADLEKAILCAIDAGYRHIDCSPIFGNEEAVGIALQMKFAYGSVKREDMFITSKLWNDCHGKGKVRSACEETLKKLKLKFLDLYLIQWPTAFQEMEKLVDAGLVKSIGLSNFNEAQIERVLKICTIKPVMLQIEISVNFLNERLVEFAHSYGIQVTAYAPLGSPGRMQHAHFPSLLEEDFVKEIARAHFKSPAQVLLRHAIQRDLIVIPKSVNPEQIRSNLNIFDFELKPEEMNILNSRGRNFRLFKFPEIKNHPEYPFKEELAADLHQ